MRVAPFRLVRAAILLAPRGAAACGATSGPIVEGRPYTSLAASPSDVSTGLDTLAVDVLATGPLAHDSSVLDPVARSASFATWPDLTPLATTFAPTATAQPGTAVAFHVQASAPVSDGWFALVVPPQATGVTLDARSFHALPDGRSVVRLRIGSAPMLRDLSVCPKPDGRTAIVVSFSEPVGLAAASTTSLTLVAGPAAAQLECTTDPLPLVGAPRASFEFVCPAPLAAKDDVSLSISDGLVSGRGASVPVGQRVFTVETFRPNLLMTECSSLIFEP
jgi:hypothetical protein